MNGNVLAEEFTDLIEKFPAIMEYPPEKIVYFKAIVDMFGADVVRQVLRELCQEGNTCSDCEHLERCLEEESANKMVDA